MEKAFNLQMKSLKLASGWPLVWGSLLKMGSLFFFLVFVFLGPHRQHMEGSRLGVELELQLLAYTTATATLDPSRICDLHHSSRQCRILNPLSEGRDRTRNLNVPSQTRFLCAMTGTPTLAISTSAFLQAGPRQVTSVVGGIL